MGFWCPVMQYTAVIISQAIKLINLQDNMDMEKKGEAFLPMDVPGLPIIILLLLLWIVQCLLVLY